MKNKMETNELTAHHRGVILRGICFGAALRGKSPEISEENAVIICQGELSMGDICSMSADAEAFGLEAHFGYDGLTKITFKPKKEKP